MRPREGEGGHAKWSQRRAEVRQRDWWRVRVVPELAGGWEILFSRGDSQACNLNDCDEEGLIYLHRLVK